MRISDWSSDVCSSDLRMRASLADYLGWETENGRLRVDDPQLAAEQFVGMLAGRLQLRAVLDVGPAPDADELARRAAYAVSYFLALYGPAQSDRSEERRGGEGGVSTMSYWLTPYHYKKKTKNYHTHHKSLMADRINMNMFI